MRIWTKLTYFLNEEGNYVIDPSRSESYEYEGEIDQLKGDSTAKASEQQSLANQQQQMAYQKQFLDMTQTQYGKQSAIYDAVAAKMQPIIDAGGTGYGAQALASMRTSATDTISQNYQQAQRALQSQAFANGGRDLPSGVNAQLSAGLAASQAQAKSGAQNQITQQDAALKQQNYWNAVNTLSGTAAGYNPLGFAGATTGFGNTANGAANSVANLSSSYTQSQGPGIGAILGGVAGGVLGAAGQAGGFSSLFGAQKKDA